MCENLLDYLARNGSLYVSDLRMSEHDEKILSIVMNTNCEQFSADDWSKSLSYIYMKPIYFSVSATAKEYYINKLKTSSSCSSCERTIR